MTLRFTAYFYPQGLAERRRVTVLIDAGGWLTFDAFERTFRCPLAAATVSSRLGRTPRFLTLPEAGRLETDDNDAIDQALRRFRHPGGRTLWLPKLERAPLAILGLMILVVVTGWSAYRHGIPVLARHTAPWVPDSARTLAGEQSLAWMERSWLEPSTLGEADQQALRDAIQRYFGGHLETLNVRVTFYSSETMGANAFALPDGTLVFTDQLVRLLDETEFLAIAAHEIGHVRHDHGIRGLISSSALLASTVLITGDSEALSEVLVAAPYALAQLSYSRDMEWEADTAAMALLRSANLPPRAFATALSKMVDSYSVDSGTEGAWREYLSSHPATRERIQRFE